MIKVDDNKPGDGNNMIKPGDIFVGKLSTFYQTTLDNYPTNVSPNSYGSYMLVVTKVVGEDMWYNSFIVDNNDQKHLFSETKRCTLFDLIDAVEARKLRIDL